MKKIIASTLLFFGLRLFGAGPFPFEIPFDRGASGFLPGDKITILSMHGSREHLEPGGNYCVEGTYQLGSSAKASLALFCTTRGPSGPTPVQDDQRIRITKGSGTFHLCVSNLADGWLHVSFYPDNSSLHGGIYFGEKGNEKTIMRDSDWFRNITAQSTAASPGANQSLIAYLGQPVAPPAHLESAYDNNNLLQAFTRICQTSGLTITKLSVDDSEFPFLLYGLLSGKHTLPPANAFAAENGYTYGGSVRGSTAAGSTYFAVNIIPDNRYPSGEEKACNRRLMLRLQMLAERAQEQ